MCLTIISVQAPKPSGVGSVLPGIHGTAPALAHLLPAPTSYTFAAAAGGYRLIAQVFTSLGTCKILQKLYICYLSYLSSQKKWI